MACIRPSIPAAALWSWPTTPQATWAVLPVRPDGTLADAVQVVTLPGQPGPHRVEQVSSHPHHVVFDPAGRFVIVPDKGLDRVFIFHFDPATGKLTPTMQGAVVARAGSGPRHAAFHPRLPIAWVLNEIASTIATYAWDAERGQSAAPADSAHAAARLHR